jgi:uncharacterized protein
MGVFHRGEIAVQSRAGVRDMAERVGRGVRDVIPPPARTFLLGLPFVVAASTDAAGDVWASLLSGEPGFARALDERRLEIGADPVAGDPLGRTLGAGAPLGILAIEPATRRRMRVNGSVETYAPGRIVLRAEEVFSNCPKYIQARDWERRGVGTPVSASGDGLTAAQTRWIEGADTFFVATHAAEGGADASHRGGAPGFVRVEGARALVWPDYQGNMMFQTLGNLALNPKAGLLFVDFDRGATLQLTGEASVDWDPEAAAVFPGAERLVRFRVARVVETEGAVPLQWTFVEASPFNP